MDKLEMVHFYSKYIAPFKLTMTSGTYELGKIVYFALAPFPLLLCHFLQLKACFPIARSLN